MRPSGGPRSSIRRFLAFSFFLKIVVFSKFASEFYWFFSRLNLPPDFSKNDLKWRPLSRIGKKYTVFLKTLILAKIQGSAIFLVEIVVFQFARPHYPFRGWFSSFSRGQFWAKFEHIDVKNKTLGREVNLFPMSALTLRSMSGVLISSTTITCSGKAK